MNFNIDDFIGGVDPQVEFDFQYSSINLTSNETIFAAVADIDKDFFCAMLPLKVTTYYQDGKQYSALVEYLLGSDETFIILPKQNCITVTLLNSAAERQYKEAIKKVLGTIESDKSPSNDANIVNFPPSNTKH